MDELFFENEKNIKKLYVTKLLAELLYLNYEFSNKQYQNASGTSIYNGLYDQPRFNKKEKEEIIRNAISLLNIKYNIDLIDFEELIFKRKKK